MSSQKQIDANRRNAQHSTGPRSDAGRAKFRRNALRDGITGQVITLSDEDRRIFEQLKAEMMTDFAPQTVMERKLAHAIAWDTWRLDHLRAIETKVYALGEAEEAAEQASAATEEGAESETGPIGPGDYDVALTDARTFRSEGKRFDLMSLYEQRLNRNLHRNLSYLRNLQAERKRNYEQDKKEEILLARLHEFNDMPIHVPTTPSKNGFVFSNEQIAIGAVRQRYLDTAASLLKITKPLNLYGTLLVGEGDSLLQKLSDRGGVSAEEKKKINSIPPDSLALRRLSNPEEFGIRQQ